MQERKPAAQLVASKSTESSGVYLPLHFNRVNRASPTTRFTKARPKGTDPLNRIFTASLHSTHSPPHRSGTPHRPQHAGDLLGRRGRCDGNGEERTNKRTRLHRTDRLRGADQAEAVSGGALTSEGKTKESAPFTIPRNPTWRLIVTNLRVVRFELVNKFHFLLAHL